MKDQRTVEMFITATYPMVLVLSVCGFALGLVALISVAVLALQLLA